VVLVVMISTHWHPVYSFFFFNRTAPTEIYTLSLHDALPISVGGGREADHRPRRQPGARRRYRQYQERAAARHDGLGGPLAPAPRSEEHTSELQSRSDLVCRLLLEKKKYKYNFTRLHYQLNLL